VRIVIADDHSVVRRGVCAIVKEGFPGVTCDEAENGELAVQLVLANPPDLVILDVSMPVLDGLGAARRIHQSFLDLPILFLTMHSASVFLAQARRAGAQGFVSKDRAEEVLLEAVNALLRHETYFPDSEEPGSDAG
jgi:two-component system, NarL family, invasion response regulator UvrY